MSVTVPRQVEFHSIKQLLNRFNANRQTERNILISVDDRDVPHWQRQIVWTEEEMGLLAFSIISSYPIGMIVLWKKRRDGVRVPIDGRQRLKAIREFAEGHVAIPDLRVIPDRFKNTKYRMLDGDEDRGYRQLDLEQRETFDDYEPYIVEYDDIDESKARDIFIKLQGGKSLTKTEVRAALGGKLCSFVTDLTTPAEVSPTGDDVEEEERARHPFFNEINVTTGRKGHRNVCDILLHEFLYPGQDKHWSTLESMYLDKATNLTDIEQLRFRRILGRFQRALEIEEHGERRILPQLRSVYLILTFFKAWKQLIDDYALPRDLAFRDVVRDFETERASNSQEVPWVNFTSALSNAGYAQNRIQTRHEILMSYVLRRYPNLTPKDRRQRVFTEAQKIAIWDRADHQCEWVNARSGQRCSERFANFRDADADHIIKWENGGPTAIENGRLLCRRHNRARR